MSDPKPEDIVEVEKIRVTSQNIDYVAERTGWTRRQIEEQYMLYRMNGRDLVILIKGPSDV